MPKDTVSLTELGFKTQLVCLMSLCYILTFSEPLRQWWCIKGGVRKHFPAGHGLNHLKIPIQPHSARQEFSYPFSSKWWFLKVACVKLTFYYLCLSFFLLPELQAHSPHMLCAFAYLTDIWFSLSAMTCLSPWKKVQIFLSSAGSDVTSTEVGIRNSVFLQ